MWGRSLAAPSILIAIGLLPSRPAMGQATDQVARAESLFRAGKLLLSQHDYARACPLLAASFDLDPGTGVLLALAICHEAQGKLASALAAYERVAHRAAEEGRADRVRVARERGAALQTLVSTLTIVPPTETSALDGFGVRRDGVPVDASLFAAGVPADGGDHLIEVSAAGKKPWRSHVWLAPASDRQTVIVPALEDAAANPIPPLAAAPVLLSSPPAGAAGTVPSLVLQPPPTAAAMDTSRKGARLRVGGIALMAAGAAAFGVGAFYGARAMSREEASKRGCQGNLCDPGGRADRLSARSAGDIATAAFVVGGVSAAAGGVLFLVGRRAPAVRIGHSTELQAHLELRPDGARVVLETAAVR